MMTVIRSVRLDYPAGANTGRANTGPPMTAVYDDANALQVRVPSSFGDIMGMADIIPEKRALTTDITASRHK